MNHFLAISAEAKKLYFTSKHWELFYSKAKSPLKSKSTNVDFEENFFKLKIKIRELFFSPQFLFKFPKKTESSFFLPLAIDFASISFVKLSITFFAQFPEI